MCIRDRTNIVPVQSNAVQASSLVEVRPQPRYTANQQIGLNIEDLVQRASATSADSMPATKPTSVTQAQVDLAVTPRLGAVLEEIELAAKNARTRSAMQRTTVTTTAKSITSPSSPTTASDVKPLVIEIYRRPRVQVFRRRDGDFERK